LSAERQLHGAKQPLLAPLAIVCKPPILLKNSKNWEPQKLRQIRWQATLSVQRRPESAAAVFGRFSAKSAGPPRLFYNANSKGLQNFDQPWKKSFSTQSAERGRSCSLDLARG
jgi:hypothetical protein